MTRNTIEFNKHFKIKIKNLKIHLGYNFGLTFKYIYDVYNIITNYILFGLPTIKT